MANKQIVIENFLKMTPEVPQYSPKNQNYLIAGANPIYYLDEGGQEQQAGPMAASIDWTSTSGPFDSYITCMIPDTSGRYQGFAVDTTGKVYAFTKTTITSLGYPTGSPTTGHYGIQIATTGDFLFYADATAHLQTTIYYIPISSIPTSWLSVGSTYGQGMHLMESFLGYIVFSDSTGTTTTSTSNRVSVINCSLGTPVIQSIPSVISNNGFGILGLKNYNNKYIAIAVGQGQPGNVKNGYTRNFLNLWDGAQSVFNQTIKIPGQFIDMEVINGILYVAVGSSTSKNSVYYLKNLQLVEVFTIQYSTMKGFVNLQTPTVLFDFKNYIGVQLTSTSELSNPLMIYGREDSLSNVQFIYNSGNTSGNSPRWNFCQIITGYDGNIYAADFNDSGFSQLWILPVIQVTGGYYQELLYKSQWIPIKNLQSLDIYYDTPPQNTNDAINVTIYGRGEDIITGSSTTALTSITKNNYLNAKRTRLDCKGFTGSEVMIQLATVNDDEYIVTTPWRPIIRKIVAITG